jgi:hypothetical protein
MMESKLYEIEKYMIHNKNPKDLLKNIENMNSKDLLEIVYFLLLSSKKIIFQKTNLEKK